MNDQDTPKRSFIEEARRTQIITAAIETLAAVGYGGASLAQIAKRAQISTSLIPYHFKDKEELLLLTLTEIASAWEGHVQAMIADVPTADEQLRRYIETSLAYMGTRPLHYAALLEIVFNARTADGTPLYRIDEEDPSVTILKRILSQGQEAGLFRSFDVHHMAIAIRGAIDEFFAEMHKSSANLEAYTADLIDLFMRVVLKTEAS